MTDSADFEFTRSLVANQELLDFWFDSLALKGQGAWRQDGDCWSCPVSLLDRSSILEAEFVVEFEPAATSIAEAYARMDGVEFGMRSSPETIFAP